jgi:hypothetical protein
MSGTVSLSCELAHGLVESAKPTSEHHGAIKHVL